MVTFMVLWLHGKPKEASSYLDSAARSVNIIIKGTPTKLNKNDIQNLYGLIVCGLAALSVQLGGDSSKATELCEKCLKEFNDSHKITEYIKHIIRNLKSPIVPPHVEEAEFNPSIKDFTDKSYKIPPIPEEALSKPLPTDEDWLISKAFQNLLLESAFYPIISPNTPALKKEELEFEQAKTKLLDIIEDSVTKSEDKRYSSSVPRNVQSRISPKRTTASVLKHRGPSQPWWQNNQFMEKVLKKSMHSRDVSARRIKKKNRETQNLPPVDMQIKDIYNARISPRRSVLKKREPKRNRPVDEHIMVEFEPTGEKEGESVPVTLVPITAARKH